MVERTLNEILQRELQRGLDIAKPEAELRAREERDRRRTLLSQAAPAITEEDVASITDERVNSTLSLQHVQHWLHIANSPSRTRKSNPVQFLVLLGGIGVGKTFAAAYALAREPGVYVTASDFRQRYTRNWQDTEWRQGVLGVRLLVVDDLGAEPRDGANEPLYEIVNRRMGAHRSLTILTGNLTEAQLRERYDERIIDRLSHVGTIVEIRGPSMRRKPTRRLT